MIQREALLALLDMTSGSGLTTDELADRILALDPVWLGSGPRPRTVILDLSPVDRTRISAQIAAKTRQEGECLIWTGTTGNQGYGVVRTTWGNVIRSTSAHRAAWMLANGPIPSADLVLDHLCRTRACVRVEHLELVTVRENVLRGSGAKTHCKRGHLLSGENLRVSVNRATGYPIRNCRECRRLWKLSHKTSSATAEK